MSRNLFSELLHFMHDPLASQVRVSKKAISELASIYESDVPIFLEKSFAYRTNSGDI